MAKGMKIAKGNAIQIDQAANPQTVAVPLSTSTSETRFIGGVGGDASAVTVLTILCNYKMADGTAKTDGFIKLQRGRKQYDIQSDADTAGTTRTRCTLVGGASQPTLSASQFYITAVAPDGTVFYPTRFTGRYVWNGSTRYRYTVGSSSAVTYVDGTTNAMTLALVLGQ